MENNNKSNEALADEELDKVAGGWGCEDMNQNMYCCSKCIKSFTIDKLNCHDGHYYCPNCGKQLL